MPVTHTCDYCKSASHVDITAKLPLGWTCHPKYDRVVTMTKKKTKIKDVSIKFVGYSFQCPDCIEENAK